MRGNSQHVSAHLGASNAATIGQGLAGSWPVSDERELWMEEKRTRAVSDLSQAASSIHAKNHENERQYHK